MLKINYWTTNIGFDAFFKKYPTNTPINYNGVLGKIILHAVIPKSGMKVTQSLYMALCQFDSAVVALAPRATHNSTELWIPDALLPKYVV